MSVVIVITQNAHTVTRPALTCQPPFPQLTWQWSHFFEPHLLMSTEYRIEMCLRWYKRTWY